MIAWSICENLSLIVWLLTISKVFSIGVPELNKAETCLVKIDKSFLDIFKFDFSFAASSIDEGFNSLSWSWLIASDLLSAVINPLTLFSFLSNAWYL